MARSKVVTSEKIDTAELTEEQLLDIYYKMKLGRAMGERQRLLQRMGKGSITYSCEGHEGAQVGMASAMTPGKDWLFPYYRDTALVLALGMTPRDVLMSFFARGADINSGGKNMPSHFSSVPLRIVSEGAPVSTQVPHAVGAALAAKMRGLDEVAVTTFGDGGSSPGDVHEAMNFAGVHKCPVIFFCQFNYFAISVKSTNQMAVENVASRAAGYGFPGLTVDGNDVLAVYRAAKEAVERARSGEGATFIEAKTYRLVPHSSDDDDKRYRTAEAVAEAAKKEPIIRFDATLRKLGVLDDAKEEQINARVKAEVDDATEWAEAQPSPAPEEALRHVYVEDEVNNG
jgi:2-oxoisovalerate dehydrogenase E1 component alpha subunit